VASTCAELLVPSSCALIPCAGTSDCFFACQEGRSWPDARTACEDLGGTLACFDEDAEWACVGPRLSIESWIGLEQPLGFTAVDAGWRWICPGSGEVDAAGWGTNEPGDQGGTDLVEDDEEQCALSYYPSGWGDLACRNPYPYLCEVSLP
jgi:hypothetical protein